jgi:photosystem II stability/assembly factor-like uncharacterized protein
LETMTKNRWHPLPSIVVSSPVFTLAAGQNGIWAGGTGGVAWYPGHPQGNTPTKDGWQPRISTLTLSLVTALTYREGLLLAGGLEGIAYSLDAGMHWQVVALEDRAASITAFALSPHFSKDHTAVAATMENGILRSDDGGRTWVNASFGLESFEVTALAWFSGSVLLAATSDGIYRSSNGGRAWRRIYEGEELGIDTIVSLSDGELLASLEQAGLLRSTDGGAHWFLDENSLRDVHIFSLFVEEVAGKDAVTPGRDKSGPYGGGKALFVGTLERGLLRSMDGGTSWETVYNGTVLSLVSGDGRLYAGTDSGVSCSDDGGRTWYDLPCPPVHDLCNLFVYEKQPLLKGAYAGIMHYTGSDWKAFPNLPQGLTGIAIAPDGSLFVSSIDGLMHLSPGGDSEGGTATAGRDKSGPYGRQILIEGQAGQVNFITFRQSGSSWQAWAASGDGTRLLRSDDEGTTWQSLRPPFGVLPVVALEVMSQRLIAATYDPRQYRVCIWSSTDDGETWERGVVAETQWPLVATCDNPFLITIGSVILVQNASGQWNKVSMSNDGGMIRRVVSMRQNKDDGKNALAQDGDDPSGRDTPGRDKSGPYGTTLIALTTTGIHRSDNWGENWRQHNEGLPVEQILDIAGDDTNLYILLAGGQVWKRRL